MGQMSVVSGLGTAPRSVAASVCGLVSAVDGNIVTVLGSELLTLEVTGRTTIEGNSTVRSNVSVTGYSLPNPVAGAGAVAPSATAFIATDISTVP